MEIRDVKAGINLQQPIPRFNLPLKPTDPELPIDLQALLLTLYDQARYHLAIDYDQNPTPPLNAEQQAWMEALLTAQGLRSATSNAGNAD